MNISTLLADRCTMPQEIIGALTVAFCTRRARTSSIFPSVYVQMPKYLGGQGLNPSQNFPFNKKVNSQFATRKLLHGNGNANIHYSTPKSSKR